MALRIAPIPLLLVCALALPSPSSAEEVTPLTLHECYQLALARSEQIAIQQELIRQTEGRFLQSLSTALPRVSFSSSDKRQDGTGDSAFRLRDVPERKFTFSQPLFSGFKEFAAMAGSRAERRGRLHDKRRAEHLLFIDVADAFHLLLQHHEDLQALLGIRDALQGRMEELRQREGLGRSRPSEVASAEAQLRRVEAEMELVRSQEATARHLLEFLTGLPRLGTLIDDGTEVTVPLTEETCVAKAALRPDVQAAEEAWQVATQEITIARAQFFPTVSAESNYYTKRVGAAEGVDWDALLKVDVPIFQGGGAVGATSEARAKARQATLQWEQLSRQAELDIRDAYVRLQAAIARRDALQHALEAAQESYRLQAEDYRLNLVSNLDVLQALQQLQDAHREVIQIRHEVAQRYWALRVAMGDLE